MTNPGQDVRSGTERMLAAAGLVVTDEGKARARVRLGEAAERMTPEAWTRRHGRGEAA